jgi:hypothetical protein
MNLENFKDLLDRYCNGELNDDEFIVMEQAMIEDQDKRSYYLRYMNLDAGLKESLDSEIKEVKSKPVIQTDRVWLRAAVLFFALGGLVFILFSFSNKGTSIVNIQVADELKNDGVAIITKAVGFDRTQAGIAKGTTLKPGLLEISTGILQVELYSGVSLILEGPANINIVDSMNVICLDGQLRANVPPQAIGFKVKAKEYDVVDLGTEFSVSVDQKSGRSDFLVHDGEIELFKQDQRLSLLKKGQGVGYENGKSLPHSIQTTSFSNIDSLDQKQGNRRFLEWKVHAENMRNNQDVALFYDFENSQSWNRTLENKSSFQQPGLNGAIVGCQWTEGRWKDKGALDYKSISDRVRLNLQGEFESVTLTAWVKIDSFDRWLSSLFLTDGYDRNELHWQLSDEGEIILGINVPGIGNTFSPSVITPEHLGQWLYIVTVVDQEKNKVLHYLNGNKVHERNFEPNFKANFGNVELGNWRNHAKKDAIRSLNGRMDEFVLFKRALSSEEVLSFYQSGKPE